MYSSRLCRSSLAKLESRIAAKKFSDISKVICSFPKDSPSVSESEWRKVVETVTDFIKSNKSSSTPETASIIPSLIITTASLGHSLTEPEKKRIVSSVSPIFDSFSVFDKIVFIIGASQVGLRTPESVNLVNKFLAERRGEIPDNFIPSILLAIANLGIQNPNAWNDLMARLNIEFMTFHDLVNTALSIVTSRTFPISSVERLVESASKLDVKSLSYDDSISLCHSLSCLEVFHTSLFRTLLGRIAECPSLDSDGAKLVKQIIISVFSDDKAKDIINSASPVLWDRLDRLLDWSMPEPLRHHGMIAGEVQEILEDLIDDIEAVSQSDAIPRLGDWNKQVATCVAMDRFYLADVPVERRRVFVHIDDETFPDLIEGPIDPYLQLKHAHVLGAGWKLVWIREAIWMGMSGEERGEFIRALV